MKILVGILATTSTFLLFLLLQQSAVSDRSGGSHPGSGSNCSLDQIIPEGKGFKTAYENYHVSNTIMKRMSTLQSCFIDHIESKPMRSKGWVNLDWQIDAKGQAFKAEKINATMGDDKFYSCLTDTINQWEFPPPPSGMIAYTSYRFKFASKEEHAAEMKAQEERMKEMRKKEIKVP